MSDKTKIIIAVVLILSGILLFAIRIYEYKKDRKKAVLDEIVDSLVFFPLIDFLFPLGMITTGIGWLIYLLKNQG